MFDNIGGKIKGYAKIIFAIFVIVGIIGAIVTWAAVGGFNGFMLFLLIGVLSVLIGYLSVMFIYGFGELIEIASLIKKNTEEIYNINYETYSKIYDTEKSISRKAPAKQATVSSTVSSIVNSGSEWRCKKCDTKNSASDNFCKGCGEAKA